jgi:hypothetical protein
MSKKEKLKKKSKSPFEPTGEVPVVLYSSTIPRTIVDRTSPVAGALKLAGFFNAIAWLILIFGKPRGQTYLVGLKKMVETGK